MSIQFQLGEYSLICQRRSASWQPVHDAKGQLNVREKGEVQ